MQLEARIKAVSADKYPIQYEAAPGKPKDCRVKIMRGEMNRLLLSQKIWACVRQLIMDNAKEPSSTITTVVNDFLDTYLEKHPD